MNIMNWKRSEESPLNSAGIYDEKQREQVILSLKEYL
jgi:hypothetical protein